MHGPSLRVCVLVSTCLTPPVLADVEWGRLKLPAAVRLEAIGYNDNAPDEPFDKIVAEIGPDWVRSEQYLWEGEFRFRLFDVTYDTMNESILCNLNTKRGRRTSRMSIVGSSRAESLVSPIVYVRMGRLAEQRGERVESSRRDGAITYSYTPAPASGIPRVEMVIDESTFEIREVRLPSPRSTSVDAYSDWKTLPDGTRHPMKVVSSYKVSGAEGSRESRVVSIELLKPDYVPARFRLPQDVQITDELRGVVTDGAGLSIGVIEPSGQTTPGMAPPVRNWDALLVPGGVTLIAASGLVWYVKRRRVGSETGG